MSVTPLQYVNALKGNNTLTVPYSTYTADPVLAMTAPSNHMTNAMPTLPADLKMTLGVAKIPPVCGLAHPENASWKVWMLTQRRSYR